MLEDLRKYEAKVCSQFGEDGVLQRIFDVIGTTNRRFVEFGAWDGEHLSNTAHLRLHHGWQGLLMEGSDRADGELVKREFVSAENVETLFCKHAVPASFDLLSIDIDGNDYWVWKAISAAEPAIVVCEYNPILGDTRPIVVPYDPDFRRDKSHYSHLYFGCSVAALRQLAAEKGYTFLGSNANGINAFFVKNDLAGSVLPLLKAQKAFPSRHRDSRDRDGSLSYAGGRDRFRLIQDMPVMDVETGETLLLRDIEAPYSEAWLKAMD